MPTVDPFRGCRDSKNRLVMDGYYLRKMPELRITFRYIFSPTILFYNSVYKIKGIITIRDILGYGFFMLKQIGSYPNCD